MEATPGLVEPTDTANGYSQQRKNNYTHPQVWFYLLPIKTSCKRLGVVG